SSRPPFSLLETPLSSSSSERPPKALRHATTLGCSSSAAPSRCPEPPERLQVPPVPSPGLGGLENHGSPAEGRMGEERPEGREADLPTTNVLVAVQPRGEAGLGIVHVEGHDPVETDRGRELAEGGEEPAAGPDVV